MADNTSCIDGAVNTSFQEMCSYLNFINTSWTFSVLDLAVAKMRNIPLLAFYCEITSFPPGRFVSTKVVGIYSLCPIYWEATPESCPCTT